VVVEHPEVTVILTADWAGILNALPQAGTFEAGEEIGALVWRETPDTVNVFDCQPFIWLGAERLLLPTLLEGVTAGGGPGSFSYDPTGQRPGTSPGRAPAVVSPAPAAGALPCARDVGQVWVTRLSDQGGRWRPVAGKGEASQRFPPADLHH